MKNLILSLACALTLSPAMGQAKEVTPSTFPELRSFVQLSLLPRLGTACGATKVGEKLYLTSAGCTVNIIRSDITSSIDGEIATLEMNSEIYVGNSKTIIKKIFYPKKTLKLLSTALAKAEKNEDAEAELIQLMARNFAVVEIDTQNDLPVAELNSVPVVEKPSAISDISELTNNQEVVVSAAVKPGYYERPNPVSLMANMLQAEDARAVSVLQDDVESDEGSKGSPVWVIEGDKLTLAGVISTLGEHPRIIMWSQFTEETLAELNSIIK